MKCLSCDCILQDFEATRKYKDTEEYIDLCTTCLDESLLNQEDLLEDKNVL